MILRVNPPDAEYMSGEQLVQETGIGYHSGNFFRSGVICERSYKDAVGEKRQKLEQDDISMQEETKEPPVDLEKKRLQDHNIVRLEQLMVKECGKKIQNRRLHNKNIDVSSYCQVENKGTSESEPTNTLYVCTLVEEGKIFRFKLNSD